jgi:hypothetical protein
MQFNVTEVHEMAEAIRISEDSCLLTMIMMKINYLLLLTCVGTSHSAKQTILAPTVLNAESRQRWC